MVALKEGGYQGVRCGHLVIHSMDAFAGAVGISDSDEKCTPEYVVCEKGRPDIELAYFASVFRVMARRGYIELSCSAVRERAPRLRWPTVGNLLLPMPKLDEQKAIVKAVSENSRRTTTSVAHLEREVALMMEYRTALITDAVTGRLDVGRAD
jgi:type I restriction enzyme S subunit